MADFINALLGHLINAPEGIVYLLLGIFAALENILPPVPADVVVLFGGFLAGRGLVTPVLVFLVVWSANVMGALAVYLVGRRYGAAFFASHWGGLLLRPRQLASLGEFYARYGARVIFFSRFFPMFRAVVPVFAGISRISFWRTAIPLALASAIWYGVIVYVGAVAGRNWGAILLMLEDASRWLWVATLLISAGVLGWWWRSRQDPDE
ncbi:MAG TPA: DedA family protein [Longimicrobiaceae bacterium]|nr:DedA family protein [Longimicrobiaceae bacterium]